MKKTNNFMTNNNKYELLNNNPNLWDKYPYGDANEILEKEFPKEVLEWTIEQLPEQEHYEKLEKLEELKRLKEEFQDSRANQAQKEAWINKQTKINAVIIALEQSLLAFNKDLEKSIK